MAYTKMFSSILDSTIWQESKETKLVWITLLAMADKSGEVQASIPGLAIRAGVSIPECETALAHFMAPDRYSRTKDDEGRRISEIDGGWFLLNHAKYRAMASDDDRRTKAAERAKRHYEKTKRNENSNAPLTPFSRQIPQAEANTDTKADAESLNNNNAADSSFSMPELKPFVSYYLDKMKKDDKGGHLPLVNWLHNQHSWCYDRWTEKPPKDWKSFTGAFTKRYVEYWHESKPDESDF